MTIPIDRFDLYEKLDTNKKEIIDKITTLNNNVVFLIKELDKIIKISKKK